MIIKRLIPYAEEAPSRFNPVNFSPRADYLADYISKFPADIDQMANEFNATAETVNNLEQSSKASKEAAEAAAQIATSSANIKGKFQPGVTNALQGETWFYNGAFWYALVNTSVTPSESGADWVGLNNHNSLVGRNDNGAHPAIEANIDTIEANIDSLEANIDTIEANIDSLEANIASLVESKAYLGLHKSNRDKAAFEVSAGNIVTSQEVKVTSNTITSVVASGTILSSVSALAQATDYVIAIHNGTLIVSDYNSIPAGAKTVGGFSTRYEAIAVHERSFWDLNWRPTTCNPRAMVLSLGDRVWGDIYLMDTEYGLNGYSRPNAQIADGGSLPFRALKYGGNGTSKYTSFSQYIAKELAAAAGKILPNTAVFEDIAYGTVTGQSSGSDPVTTKYQAGSRSAIGCEQVTGAMWQWGSEVWDRGNGNSGYAWYAADTDNKGQVFSSGAQGVGAVRFGARWDGSVSAGARASDWFNEPWYSEVGLSARGFCDHFKG